MPPAAARRRLVGRCASVVSALALACCSISSLAGADAPAITPPDAAPVAGYPVGWCIRARAEVVAEAKAAGFEFVELALQDVLGLADDEFQKFATALRESGVRALSGYNPVPRDLKLVGPEADAAKQDEHLRRVIERAAALKLTYLIFNSGNSWRVPDGFDATQARAQLVDFARRFANAAAAQGLTVLVQPLRNSDSNQITTVADALKLVDEVNLPGFALMVDYSFLTIQGENPRVLLPAGRRLRHVHMANPAANRSYPMSDDESDYAAFFAVLKEIGYRGGLSVHGGTKSFATDAPRAITFLRSKGRELAAANK